MHRRTLLRAAGIALGASTAGCAAVLGTPCEPGADRIGDVDARRPVRNGGDEYAVRGTVVGYTLFGVYLDDGTGKAALEPRASGVRIDEAYFPEGDCVRATGALDGEETRENAMPVLSVAESDIESLGDSKMAVEPLGDHPSPLFDFEVPSGSAIRFTVDDGDDALAGNVFAAYSDTAVAWSDLDPDSGPADGLARGDSMTLRDVHGEWVTLQWRSPDRTWGRRLGRFGAPGV